MTASDQTFVDGLVAAFLPVTARTDGLRNEGAAVDPGARYDLAKIAAPTLVLHSRDDGINPFAFGACIAGHIPGCATFPTGSRHAGRRGNSQVPGREAP